MSATPPPSLAPASVEAFCLVGATATGKTAVAHRLAGRLGLPILSIDSMMVYRGMDIGTAKPVPEERRRYRYLGLDVADPGQPFTVADFLRAVSAQVQAGGHRRLLVCGGTGLYLSALLRGIDPGPAPDPVLREELERTFHDGGLPALHRRLEQAGAAADLPPGDAQNPRRVMRAIERAAAGVRRGRDWSAGARPTLAGLRLPREMLRARIDERVDRMFESGLMAEARALAAAGPLSATAAQAIGYAEALAAAEGRLDEAVARERARIRTRQYARRQDTWFRRQERVEWVDRGGDESEDLLADRVHAVWTAHGPAPLRLPAFDTAGGPG